MDGLWLFNLDLIFLILRGSYEIIFVCPCYCDKVPGQHRISFWNLANI